MSSGPLLKDYSIPLKYLMVMSTKAHGSLNRLPGVTTVNWSHIGAALMFLSNLPYLVILSKAHRATVIYPKHRSWGKGGGGAGLSYFGQNFLYLNLKLLHPKTGAVIMVHSLLLFSKKKKKDDELE